MSTFTDIANWVVQDYLNRADLLSVAQTAAVNFYKVITAKIPFDILMTTTPELPVISGTDTYDLTSGPTQVWPPLRALASNRFTFQSGQNSRRLRRSHVRVYDSLTFTQPGNTATYARWGNTLVFNPPPNASTYTFRLRYWSYPVVGIAAQITNVTWAGGIATYSCVNSFPNNTDQLVITGIVPAGFNLTSLVPGGSLTPTSFQASIPTNPGPYAGGGWAVDVAPAVQYSTSLVTPLEWDELMKWETLYRVYHYVDQQEKAMALVQPPTMPRQATPKKVPMVETGIIPRLWNDLLTTISQQENVDEDFSINPVIRAYSFR